MRTPYPFPDGLKEGDFVQGLDHFGDVYFEAESVLPPTPECPHWVVFCYRFERSGKPVGLSIGPSQGLRRVVQAEMGLPVLLSKRARIHSSQGLYP